MKEFYIENKKIGLNHPTYFIADIGANHDGDLNRAKDLIYLCAESGVDAVKFQHFSASTIVSDKGFKALGEQISHQKKWKKSVYEIYQDASINPDWTSILKETSQKAGVSFFTSPYSFELVDLVDQYIPAYKVGSGDITWLDIIQYMAKKGKPMLLATGAASMDEVSTAMETLFKHTSEIVLMQCNTNYTGDKSNFKYINLNVLKMYARIYPDIILGLSDHTPGCSTVLGAVTLGARVIEKHFTDDNNRLGPDHPFSMTPSTWREMVDRTRELEWALGEEDKIVMENEKETVVLQRRSIKAKNDLQTNKVLSYEDFEMLRPCPADAISPRFAHEIIGKKINKPIPSGDSLRWADIV